jgi:threonine dehydrogenase-like Zn-dependent dehydrogenase
VGTPTLGHEAMGVEQFATHRLPLASAPDAYETLQKKEDRMAKVVLKP